MCLKQEWMHLLSVCLSVSLSLPFVSVRAVKCVSFLPCGLRVVSGSDDTSLRVWDMATESCLARLPGHEVCKQAHFACVCARISALLALLFSCMCTLWFVLRM